MILNSKCIYWILNSMLWNMEKRKSDHIIAVCKKKRFRTIVFTSTYILGCLIGNHHMAIDGTDVIGNITEKHNIE